MEPGASAGDGRSPERGRRGEPGRGRTWARRQVRRPTGEERAQGGRGPRRDTRAGSPRAATAAAAQGRHHGVRNEPHPEKGFLQAGHQQDRLGAAQDLPGAGARRQRGLRSCVVRPGDPRRQRRRGPPLWQPPRAHTAASGPLWVESLPNLVLQGCNFSKGPRSSWDRSLQWQLRPQEGNLPHRRVGTPGLLCILSA